MQELQGLDGIKRITSTASEGMGRVVVELELGADTRKVLDDVKARVDAIDTFPEEAERPVIQEVIMKTQVINVAVSGVAEEAARLLAAAVGADGGAPPTADGNVPTIEWFVRLMRTIIK